MYVTTTDYQASNAAETFTSSLIDTGFAVLSNHPINMDLVNHLFEQWRTFFASDEKFNYRFSKETQDGYFPLEIAEKAKGHDIKDIKEFFHVYPWGQIPETLKQDTLQLYNDLSALAGTLLQWIENYTPEHIRTAFSMPLNKMITNSTKTMLRVLHYPPFEGTETPGAIRAAAHEDINLITILPAATASGLEVKDIKGNWHSVSCDPGTLAINIGDMLQMCSRGYYPSTTHRVTNPQGEAAKQSRLSMPLFLHARPEVRLSPTHTAGEYLQERLRELGLI
jgi:isopenicillin N synthase-like dioxygenase